MKKEMMGRVTALVLAALLAGQTAGAAVIVLHQETFSGSAPGSYTDRDGTFLTSGYNGGVGNTSADVDAGATGGSSPSGPGSYEGSFGSQAFFSYQEDAIRITDAGFLANYPVAYPGYSSYSWAFAFMADDIVPMSLVVSMSDGVNTFNYNALSQVTSAGSWHTVSVPLSGWSGGPGAFPGYNLSGMSYIDITWARQGTGAQQYYFDDFTLFGNTSSTAIPEPNTLLLLSVAGAGLFTIRRRLILNRAQHGRAEMA